MTEKTAKTVTLTLTEADANWLLAVIEDAKNQWEDLKESDLWGAVMGDAEFEEAVKAVSEVEEAVHLAWTR